MTILYYGFENEFRVYEKGKMQRNIQGIWNERAERYTAPHNTDIIDHAITTYSGSLLYPDGMDVAEACTPPTIIRPGFATQVSHVLRLTRHELADFMGDDVKLVGYSMHHNITNNYDRVHQRTYMNTVGVPLALFALTPLSIGMCVRYKDDRVEFAGDHIPDEEQASMLALFAAAMTLGHPRSMKSLPMLAGKNTWIDDYRMTSQLSREDDILSSAGTINNPVAEGRNTQINVRLKNRKMTTVSAQQYLEAYWQAFMPVLEKIGTPSELDLLASYVRGERKLEIDKSGKYEELKEGKKYEDYPLHTNTTLKTERNVAWTLTPYGSVINAALSDVRTIENDWDEVGFYFDNNERTHKLELYEIDTITLIGETLMRIRTPEERAEFIDSLCGSTGGQMIYNPQIGRDIRDALTKDRICIKRIIKSPRNKRERTDMETLEKHLPKLQEAHNYLRNVSPNIKPLRMQWRSK